MTGLDALQRPSLDALLPRLVEHDELPAAGALSSLRTNMGMIAGPALGGVLVATLGLPGSAGVPAAAVSETLIAPFNDLAAVEAQFAAWPGQIGHMFRRSARF